MVTRLRYALFVTFRHLLDGVVAIVFVCMLWLSLLVVMVVVALGCSLFPSLSEENSCACVYVCAPAFGWFDFLVVEFGRGCVSYSLYICEL